MQPRVRDLAELQNSLLRWEETLGRMMVPPRFGLLEQMVFPMVTGEGDFCLSQHLIQRAGLPVALG